ncbi:endolytic transglycosylase MltG [Salinibacillus xinjiangensis]|uniref:Endolytic murein transglycosylase n=1 Tax=Salinibacillus xinjiangensis TaxID=1229268 RepID=A0A6G1X701_9BACI|nr:endolytic transglycosylase MltG [Salinibacillus xinjiangensis]MRG86685.1 endolytic transglycosylase MltG [Salinibacillus xinjiangensis]
MSTSNQDDQQKKKIKNRYEEARTVRRVVLIVLAIILVILTAVGVSGYYYVKSALEPVAPNSDEVKNVEIPLGSTVSRIGSILEQENIINNGTVFRYYVKFKNEADFQAGEYELSPSMTLDEIIESLKTGSVMEEAVVRVTIPEGKTIEEMASIFANHTSVKEEEFLERVNDREYVKSLIELYPVLTEDILKDDIRYYLEGYLFAATYDFFTEDPTPEQIIEKMLDKTEEVVLQYMDQFEKYELTIHEAVTMASLVENEAREYKDRRLIAGVFYNRMEEGMPLQTDPTVLYALGEHKDRVLNDYLKIDSPYNTYMYADLPIGPISNFAENALQAVVEPKDSNYLYFLAASDDGTIYYSETNAEHNRKREKYIHH